MGIDHRRVRICLLVFAYFIGTYLTVTLFIPMFRRTGNLSIYAVSCTDEQRSTHSVSPSISNSDFP